MLRRIDLNSYFESTSNSSDNNGSCVYRTVHKMCRSGAFFCIIGLFFHLMNCCEGSTVYNISVTFENLRYLDGIRVKCLVVIPPTGTVPQRIELGHSSSGSSYKAIVTDPQAEYSDSCTDSIQSRNPQETPTPRYQSGMDVETADGRRYRSFCVVNFNAEGPYSNRLFFVEVSPSKFIDETNWTCTVLDGSENAQPQTVTESMPGGPFINIKMSAELVVRRYNEISMGLSVTRNDKINRSESGRKSNKYNGELRCVIPGYTRRHDLRSVGGSSDNLPYQEVSFTYEQMYTSNQGNNPPVSEILDCGARSQYYIGDNSETKQQWQYDISSSHPHYPTEI